MEAQSLTFRNTTATCPNTEVTLCTCMTISQAVSWKLPGGERQLSFGGQDCIGTNISVGAYTAVITNDTGGRESVLKLMLALSVKIYLMLIFLLQILSLLPLQVRNN